MERSVQEMAQAQHDFGWRLFARECAIQPGKNILVSPPSLALALAMTYNGAEGETAQAMAETLRVDGWELEEVNALNGELMAALRGADPAISLHIANALWAKADIPFGQDFLARVSADYDARIEARDFSDPDASEEINGWVRERTQGKIDQIVGQIHPLTILFLVNAIYFKGAWQSPFDPAKTKPGDFYLADGSRCKRPMMDRSGSYGYWRDKDWEAIRLPYGSGRLATIIILPKPQAALYDVIEAFDTVAWKRLRRFLDTPQQGRITMPRFTIEYGRSINDTLSFMGMGIAFDPYQAQFRPMSMTEPYISDVLHVTRLEVNEEGAEAAAATKVEMRMRSIMMDAPFHMVVDRPFICTIEDTWIGATLFAGAVYEPEEVK